jgi:DNA-binding response OmpR family regulator
MPAFRVLLVEDSELYRHLVRSMLSVAKGAEFTLDEADTLAGCREAIEKSQYDAVLLDLMLPDSGGLDTLRGVVAAAENTPILVLTSLDDETASLQSLHEGAADYLIKSEVSANWLARSIAYAIERRRVTLPEPAVADEKESTPSLLPIRQSDDDESVFVARFTDRRLVSVVTLERVRLRLLSLIKQERVETIHLDFSHVEYVANAAISMLLIANKRANENGCKLILDHVPPAIYENFTTRRFDKVFDIRQSE